MGKLGRAEVIAYLRNNRDRMEREYGLETIALIGSVARGDYTDDSDVDVIVRFRPGTRQIFELKRRLKTELEAAVGRPVEIASEKYLKPYYRTEVLKEAVYV